MGETKNAKIQIHMLFPEAIVVLHDRGGIIQIDNEEALE